MACPFDNKNECKEEGGKMLYAEYLMLNKILSAQHMLSANATIAHDEHLFIITHQTYELWFKQIIYELDLIRVHFQQNITKAIRYSEISKRLHRIVVILQLLINQFPILETMSATDFVAFRDHLSPASGFQSLQFRLLENKLGLAQENRKIRFNANYTKLFQTDNTAMDAIEKSLSEPTLLQLVEQWLENTPHLDTIWPAYIRTVATRLLYNTADDERVDDTALKRKRELFETVLDVRVHDALHARGERKLSHRALRAAIAIACYKDEREFGAQHQLLMLLIDVDAALSKWRYNHVVMVQRMIGALQVGTGGSSGYQYLKSTLSDRYKPFVDLANMASFIVQREHLVPLQELLTTDEHASCENIASAPNVYYNSASEDEKKEFDSSLELSSSSSLS